MTTHKKSRRVVQHLAHDEKEKITVNPETNLPFLPRN